MNFTQDDILTTEKLMSDAYYYEDKYLIQFVFKELKDPTIKMHINFLFTNNSIFKERLSDLKKFLSNKNIQSYKDYVSTITQYIDNANSKFIDFLNEENSVTTLLEKSLNLKSKDTGMIHFEIPKYQSSIIKVIGIGGGGSNAVNRMHNLGIENVDFIVCNTDSQALALSEVHNKIQLGPHLTQGLGAGANPEIGKQAAEESLNDLSKILEVNTRMVFITAGMGGGTGSGGAPIVAKNCRDLGILTVGIVTTPFRYEGRKRLKQALEGINQMRDYVDTLLVISNDKLRQQYGNLPFTQAFAEADNVLATATKCITDVINTTGQINVDFADVCTVMKNGGVAILGNAAVAGENRAQKAVEQALNSPLLNDSDITGAKWVLLNIMSSAGEFEHTMDEAEIIQAYVQDKAGANCDVILGMGHNPFIEDKIAVTIIATGFNYSPIKLPPSKNSNKMKKTTHPLLIENIIGPPKIENQTYDLPIVSIGRTLTATEMEERKIFEEQKRALEERASRLRHMSFSDNVDIDSSHFKNIPALCARVMQTPDNTNESENLYSSYRVAYNDKSCEVNISTINTFLDGKKPD